MRREEERREEKRREEKRESAVHYNIKRERETETYSC